MNKQIKIGLKVTLTESMRDSDTWSFYIGKPFVVNKMDDQYIILTSPKGAPVNPTADMRTFWDYFHLFDEQLEFDFNE